MKLRLTLHERRQVVREPNNPVAPIVVTRVESATYANLCQLLAQSPAVLYSCGPGPDHPTTFVSDNVIDQLGHSPNDFYDDPYFWTSLLHPDDSSHVLTELSKFENKDRVSYEYRIRHKDGHYLWMHDQLSIVRDQSGHVSMLVGSWFDVTERKRIEAVLVERQRLAKFGAAVRVAFGEKRKLQETLRHCVEALVDDLDASLARIWTIDKTESVLRLRASAGMYTHLDGPHSRIPLGELKIGKIAQECKPQLTNKVLGDPRINDQDWAKREGIVAFAGYPLEVENHVVGVMAMFARSPLSDATLEAMSTVAQVISLGIERSRTEAALRRAERLASIGTLAAGIAHEINNPLTSISLTAQVALANGANENRRTDTEASFKSIVRDAGRCGQIINNVLQFSRIGTADESPYDLNEIIQLAVDSAKGYVQEKGATIEFEADQDLPPASVNPGQIEQVLANVIRNAVESGSDGNHVLICTEQTLSAVRILISDQGCGMTLEQKSRMFDPFYTTRNKEGGTGLGLSIAHGIVTSHGGTIDVDSLVGRGTTVTIELPLAR